jgi:urease alpha subunit
VDAQTFEVRADVRLLLSEPPTQVPLSRRYMPR